MGRRGGSGGLCSGGAPARAPASAISGGRQLRWRSVLGGDSGCAQFHSELDRPNGPSWMAFERKSKGNKLPGSLPKPMVFPALAAWPEWWLKEEHHTKTWR